MNSNLVRVLFALVVLLASCKKEDPSAIDFGYDYFPNKVGSYVIFDVDSTAYNGTEEVFSYQLKEIIAEEFVDDVGEPACKVECYIRHFNGQPWVLRSVCVQKRGSTNAERVEDNQRTILMEFPIAEGGTWNGNAYNNRGATTFKYLNVAKPIDIGIQEFTNSVTVQMEHTDNLVEQNVSRIVFAKNVGNIYRFVLRTETQNNFTTGYRLECAAISYGME